MAMDTGQVGAVADETGDVILGHFGQLFLEEAFEACEYDAAFSGAVIVDDSELDVAVSFFYDCWLWDG